MKQIAQNYKTGELTLVDAPVPACRPGGVLVRTEYSLISSGTELMKVGEAKLSLLGKVRARPDQVRSVLDTLAQQGPEATFKKVMNRLDAYTPLGYSLCGTVIEVGAGVTGFAVGQRVACAGNQYALHAEVNWVPVNLCVPVPDEVDPRHAAFTTVGAIAMQGLRQADMALGEVACVIGLGLIGQLLVQLLRANGVRVVGIDISPERCALAEEQGAVCAAGPDGADLERVVAALAELTGGFGADAIFLSAGGDSNTPVELAARLARDRGRVIDIGKCSLDLPWNAYYEKELDVRFSRSYGPGRYDDRYELEGIDYPAGYVRWTERRNLGCFLDLVAAGSLEVGTLVSGTHPLDDAAEVYEQLRTGSLRGVGFLFRYPEVAGPEGGHRGGSAEGRSPVPTSTRRPPRPATPTVRLGFVGAGSYATSMLLPHLAKHAGVTLGTVATTRSLSAANAQRTFGFESVTTDAEDVLSDPTIDAVFVVTRHHSHARFVCRALEHGKAVFVEKPLALTRAEVDGILEVVERTGNDRIMVGFNRRFAPLLVGMRQRFGATGSPVSARYLVNAGRMDSTSWYLDEQLEGSRFLGEGGHFVDTVSWWVGHHPVEVSAVGTPDGSDLHATLRFADGSLATITYSTTGDPRVPKETLDVSGGGRNARLENFSRATVWTAGGRDARRSFTGQDKGQRAELDSFVEAVRLGAAMPIGLESLVATTRATIAVGESLVSGAPVAP